eukprot:TRINITY_DN8211_c0_g1_i1.p1 TRINITY_DN8211_c0_g1~~TRINITY_DN8211_c0_g1_i1.p1  ORF type:complete len:2009 (-),score=482.27 TRINITY_DN8211_c0_g1_i1:60-6050(-)
MDVLSLDDLLQHLNSEDEAILHRTLLQFQKQIRNDDGLLGKYLGVSPECAELLAIWEAQHENRTSNVSIATISLLSDILFKTNTDAQRSRSVVVGRKIIKSKLKILYSLLTSSVRPATKATLKLLAAIGELSTVTARELQQRFDFSLPVLARLGDPRQKEELSSHIHEHYTRFALSFIKSGDANSIKALLTAGTFLSNVFSALESDRDAVLLDVFHSFTELVVLNREVPRKEKGQFFSLTVLQKISVGYDREAAVVAATHTLLMHLCCSPRHGVSPDQKGWNVNNAVLAPGARTVLRFIGALKSPSTLMRQLVVETLKANPALQLPYLKSFPFAAEPRPSSLWLVNAAFMIQLIDLPVPPFGVSPPAEATLLSGYILPLPMTRAHLSKGLQHSNGLVKYMSVSILLAVLKKMEAILDAVNTAGWTEVADAIRDDLRAKLPDLSLLLGLCGQCVQKVSGSEQTQVVNEPLYLRVLCVIGLFQRLMPEVLVDTTFDFMRLLTRDVTNYSVAVQYGILSLLRSVPALRWSGGASGADGSHLGTMFRLLLSCTEAAVYEQVHALLTNILLETSVFDGCESEIDLWISALDESVIGFMDATIISASHKQQTLATEARGLSAVGDSAVDDAVPTSAAASPLSAFMLAALRAHSALRERKAANSLAVEMYVSRVLWAAVCASSQPQVLLASADKILPVDLDPQPDDDEATPRIIISAMRSLLSFPHWSWDQRHPTEKATRACIALLRKHRSTDAGAIIEQLIHYVDLEQALPYLAEWTLATKNSVVLLQILTDRAATPLFTAKWLPAMLTNTDHPSVAVQTVLAELPLQILLCHCGYDGLQIPAVREMLFTAAERISVAKGTAAVNLAQLLITSILTNSNELDEVDLLNAITVLYEVIRIVLSKHASNALYLQVLTQPLVQKWFAAEVALDEDARVRDIVTAQTANLMRQICDAVIKTSDAEEVSVQLDVLFGRLQQAVEHSLNTATTGDAQFIVLASHFHPFMSVERRHKLSRAVLSATARTAAADSSVLHYHPLVLRLASGGLVREDLPSLVPQATPRELDLSAAQAAATDAVALQNLFTLARSQPCEPLDQLVFSLLRQCYDRLLHAASLDAAPVDLFAVYDKRLFDFYLENMTAIRGRVVALLLTGNPEYLERFAEKLEKRIRKPLLADTSATSGWLIAVAYYVRAFVHPQGDWSSNAPLLHPAVQLTLISDLKADVSAMLSPCLQHTVMLPTQHEPEPLVRDSALYLLRVLLRIQPERASPIIAELSDKSVPLSTVAGVVAAGELVRSTSDAESVRWLLVALLRSLQRIAYGAQPAVSGLESAMLEQLDFLMPSVTPQVIGDNVQLVQEFSFTTLTHRLDSVGWLTALYKMIQSKWPGIRARQLHYEISHSDTFAPLLRHNNEEVRYAALQMYLALITSSPYDTCHVRVLPWLLAAYSASMKRFDQLMVRVFQVYAVAVIPFANVTMGWGALAAKYDAEDEVMDVTRTFLLEGGLSTASMLATLANYPYERTAKPDAEVAQSDVYDPAFLLPFFVQLLTDGDIDMRRFIELGGLSFAIMSLCLEDDGLRETAYGVMSSCVALISESEMREKMQFEWLLHSLKNAVTTANMKLPAIHCLLLAHMSLILLRPEHDVYLLLNKYILTRPFLDITDVPLFYSLFNSATAHHQTDRRWMLQLLVGGLHSFMDYKLYRRRHIFEMVMAYFDSHLSDAASRTLVLQLLERAASFPSVSGDLMDSAVVGWLRGIIATVSATVVLGPRALIPNPSLEKRSRVEVMHRMLSAARVLSLMQQNVPHHIPLASEEFAACVPTLINAIKSISGLKDAPVHELLAVTVKFTCAVLSHPQQARYEYVLANTTCDDMLALIQLQPEPSLRAGILRAVLLNTRLWDPALILQSVDSFIQLARWCLQQLPALVSAAIPLHNHNPAGEDVVLACLRWLGDLVLRNAAVACALVARGELMSALFALEQCVNMHAQHMLLRRSILTLVYAIRLQSHSNE